MLMFKGLLLTVSAIPDGKVVMAAAPPLVLPASPSAHRLIPPMDPLAAAAATAATAALFKIWLEVMEVADVLVALMLCTICNWGPVRELGGLILFSFCRRLQNQTRTTSFSIVRLSASMEISSEEGFGF